MALSSGNPFISIAVLSLYLTTYRLIGSLLTFLACKPYYLNLGNVARGFGWMGRWTLDEIRTWFPGLRGNTFRCEVRNDT
jgi:hypothetical protein